ncbi:MAG: N-acetylmuramoyl-L-alanine amidase [Candidatus Dojkabacteria bacterium]
MARILVSAAHTLESPGAINGDLREADLTRNILKKVIPHLEKTGVEFKAVPLDLPLLQRIDWINETGFSEASGDIFLEIHINDGNKRGIEAWFKGSGSEDNKSQKLATKVADEVCKKTNYQNQGTKSEFDHDLGSLLILNQINPTGVAIEFLYIDNEEDIKILKDDAKLDELAKLIADSMADFAKNDKTKPAETTTETKVKSPLFPMNDKPMTTPPSALSGGFGSGFPSMGATPSSPASKTNTLMDRGERTEMIKKIYKKILGKEPNQNDLNFNLNTAVSEEDLTKKLLESKEFEEMVKDAAEAKELRTKATKAESELATISGSIADMKDMAAGLNRLLEQKNKYIGQLHGELERNNLIKKGERFNSGTRKISNEAKKLEGQASLKSTLIKILMKVFDV